MFATDPPLPHLAKPIRVVRRGHAGEADILRWGVTKRDIDEYEMIQAARTRTQHRGFVAATLGDRLIRRCPCTVREPRETGRVKRV